MKNKNTLNSVNSVIAIVFLITIAIGFSLMFLDDFGVIKGSSILYLKSSAICWSLCFLSAALMFALDFAFRYGPKRGFSTRIEKGFSFTGAFLFWLGFCLL